MIYKAKFYVIPILWNSITNELKPINSKHTFLLEFLVNYHVIKDNIKGFVLNLFGISYEGKFPITIISE
jgi:hypothetical protein